MPVRPEEGQDGEEVEAELRILRERILTDLRDERSDPDSLTPLIHEIARLQSELEAKAVTQLFQERELLTPEQREMYFSQMEGRLRRGRGYRGGRVDTEEDLTQPRQPGMGKKGKGKGRRR